IGPDPRNFNQRVSLGRNDLLIRTFPSALKKGISDIKGSGSSLSSRVEQWTLSWQSKVTS
ncbi:hypothetical protein PO524_25660, partial [Klebsiella pneumoniae]